MPSVKSITFATASSIDVSIWPWAGDTPFCKVVAGPLSIVLDCDERSGKFTLYEDLRLYAKDKRDWTEQPKWAFALTNAKTEIFVRENAGGYMVDVKSTGGGAEASLSVSAAVGAKMHASLTRELASHAKAGHLRRTVVATSAFMSKTSTVQYRAKKTVFGFAPAEHE